MGHCNSTCGGGMRKKYRSEIKKEDNDVKCIRQIVEEEPCNVEKCRGIIYFDYNKSSCNVMVHHTRM